MKNKLFRVISVLVIISMLLCSCAKGVTNQPSEENERLLFLDMYMCSLYALDKVGEANSRILKASLELESVEDIQDSFEQAITLLDEAKLLMKNVISAPNLIDEEYKKLINNYQITYSILNGYKEGEEFEKIALDGAYSHYYLMSCSKYFVHLYNIREFDQLPDEEADKMLKEEWWKFGFDESIECPDTIDELELYKMLAKEYCEEELSQETIEIIEELRKTDDLTSKDQNKKWMELVVCSTVKTGMSDDVPVFITISTKSNFNNGLFFIRKDLIFLEKYSKI